MLRSTRYKTKLKKPPKEELTGKTEELTEDELKERAKDAADVALQRKVRPVCVRVYVCLCMCIF